MSPRPLVIGLSGGVASGKSLVAALFAERGAVVLDADRFAREACERADVRRAIAERFGPSVLEADGAIDRRGLAERVFGDDTARRDLEAILHPIVRGRIEDELDRIALSGEAPLVVLDVPLLHESGLDGLCDAVLFVDTPAEVREQRARRERGWPAGERERREKIQKTIEEKRRLADYTINNDGSIESLRAQVRAILQRLSPLPSPTPRNASRTPATDETGEETRSS